MTTQTTAIGISSHDMDRRILRRELDLLVAPTQTVLIATPIWSAAVCWIMGGGVPAFGAAPLISVILWSVCIAISTTIGFVIHSDYCNARDRSSDFNPHDWLYLIIFSGALMSASWSSLIWFFWDEANPVNQLGLTIFILCGIMNGVIGRMNKFETYAIGTGVAVVVSWARFLESSSDIAAVMSVLIPLWFIALSVNIRAVSQRIRKNIQTQIEHEALTEALARARDEANLQRKSAESANSMKSNFLANMSHELRTPLNAILGFSEIISSQAFGPSAQEKYRDYASDILTSGNHLLSLINDLLDIAKIEAGKMEIAPEWIQSEAIASRIERLMGEKAESKGLTLTVDVKVNKVFADERALNQILFNLVSNAIKFTQAGGVTVTIAAKEANVSVMVSDTGIGIPEAHLARVFAPFEQCDNRFSRNHGGTGLGLTLVNALAALHGGACHLESEIGKGTTVEVKLPLPETVDVHKLAAQNFAA